MRKKRTKLVIGLIALMLFAFGAGKLIDMSTKESNTQDISEQAEQAAAKSDIPYIGIDENGIVEHAGEWYTFVQDCENSKTTAIRLHYKYEAAPANITLEFDGANYLCFGKKYKYLLELTGRNPNAAENTTYVILSNEPYSFRDISNSIFSSNSNDQLPYMLLFFR